MGGKSADAFRTISEVSDLIGTPAHVLRFWETKFGQIRPVKRAGGRRYYRPADVALIDGIRRLLHDDGMTIRGAQKILREKGQRHVMALSRFADGIAETAGSGDAPEASGPVAEAPAAPQAVVATRAAERPADVAPDEAPELPLGDPPPARIALHVDPPGTDAIAAPAGTAARTPAGDAAAPPGDAVGAETPAEEHPSAAPEPPVSALLRRFRPDAAQRAALTALEPRLAALGARLAAPPPGSAG